MSKLAISCFLLALVLVASCKKSNHSSSSTGGTITATVDGTPMTFNNILVAKDTSILGAYAITISGISALSANAPELSFTVDGPDTVTSGTYSISSTGMTDDLPALSFSQGTTLVYESDISGTYPSSIVITTLTKTNIQGTFTGTITLQLGSGATTKTITDGKFNVNFK
jgi:hypothetical protein